MDNTENIEHLRKFMDHAREEIAGLGILKRVENRYPFDGVADETLSKAFALARSVVILIENGQPEEAFGLSRSLVEAALNMRWLTADRGQIQARSVMFVRYGIDVKNFWYWWVRKRFAGEKQADEADAYAKIWNLVADPTGAFRHWSGERQFTRASSEVAHPLSADELTADDHGAKRAQDYFFPSCFVHCSQPGLDNYFSDDRRLVIHGARSGQRDFARSAIFICNSYLHDLVAYALYGMNVHLKRELDSFSRHQFDPEVDEYRFSDGA